MGVDSVRAVAIDMLINTYDTIFKVDSDGDRCRGSSCGGDSWVCVSSSRTRKAHTSTCTTTW